MKPYETMRKTKYQSGMTAGVIAPLILLAAVLPTIYYMHSSDRPEMSLQSGKVQEEAGFRIVALARFDQDRQARLQEQWNRTLQQYTAFENGRKARLQELLGQSIANTAQTIWMKQEGIDASVIQARAELQRFNEEQPARWQEKIGMAAVAAYRNAPEGGEAFLAAFQHETTRLQKIQERTLLRLESDLGSLTARQAELHDAIPAMYSEAIHSANRSAEMMEASEMARVGRIFGQLQTDLSWKRSPEDYLQQVAVVREIQKGNTVVGGFFEYGLWAVAGLVMAMVWMGSAITKDPV
jgi:hypothetical protein